MVFDHKNSDWKKYKKLMKESLPRTQINLDSITTKQQIDDVVDDFTSNILETYRQSTPLIANNNSSKYMKLPKFIKDLKKQETILVEIGTDIDCRQIILLLKYIQKK